MEKSSKHWQSSWYVIDTVRKMFAPQIATAISTINTTIQVYIYYKILYQWQPESETFSQEYIYFFLIYEL